VKQSRSKTTPNHHQREQQSNSNSSSKATLNHHQLGTTTENNKIEQEETTTMNRRTDLEPNQKNGQDNIRSRRLVVAPFTVARKNETTVHHQKQPNPPEVWLYGDVDGQR